MRFRQQTDTPPPQVDLIPMLTVMMGVLAFFVVITMTLGSERQVDVDLPAPEPEKPAPTPLTTQPFIIKLEADGQIRLNDQPIDKATLKAQMEAHLNQRADNRVYLLPSRELSYEKVMQFMGEMRAIGGDRVSLAIEE